ATPRRRAQAARRALAPARPGDAARGRARLVRVGRGTRRSPGRRRGGPGRGTAGAPGCGGVTPAGRGRAGRCVPQRRARLVAGGRARGAPYRGRTPEVVLDRFRGGELR